MKYKLIHSAFPLTFLISLLDRFKIREQFVLFLQYQERLKSIRFVSWHLCLVLNLD